jgi:cytochrome c553
MNVNFINLDVRMSMTFVSFASQVGRFSSPIFFLGIFFAQPVVAGDASLGRQKAMMACAVCHGPMGMASMPSAPNLAGQVPDYLAEQLKNYRSGKRAHEVMAVIAKQLSDEDIANLAAWYASIKVSVEPSP